MYRMRLGFWRLVLATAGGGVVLQFSSCDPAVQDALVGGLETSSQSLASLLITALFESFAGSGL